MRRATYILVFIISLTLLGNGDIVLADRIGRFKLKQKSKPKMLETEGRFRFWKKWFSGRTKPTPIEPSNSMKGYLLSAWDISFYSFEGHEGTPYTIFTALYEEKDFAVLKQIKDTVLILYGPDKRTILAYNNNGGRRESFPVDVDLSG